MADKIIDGDTYAWNRGRPGNKGKTKYQHLLDGNARELKIADYGATNASNLLIAIRKAARDRRLTYRGTVVDARTVAFQVTGKLDD